jgi:hypothetical protein
LVVGRLRCAEVEAGQGGDLGAVEVGVVVIAAHLEDYDVEPGCGEHTRRRAPARTRADDHDVAEQIRVGRDLQRLQGLRRGTFVLSEWTGVAHRLPHRIG